MHKVRGLWLWETGKLGMVTIQRLGVNALGKTRIRLQHLGAKGSSRKRKETRVRCWTTVWAEDEEDGGAAGMK